MFIRLKKIYLKFRWIVLWLFIDTLVFFIILSFVLFFVSAVSSVIYCDNNVTIEKYEVNHD